MSNAQDEIDRLEAEKLVGIHRTAIESLDEQIKKLQRKRAVREDLLARAEILASGTKPCETCKRVVKSPCHTRGGMLEHGPWDEFCKEFMEQ